MVLIILVHYNNSNECLNLIRQLNSLKIDEKLITVVDNNSKEFHVSTLQNYSSELQFKIIINETNIGYGGAINIGFLENYTKAVKYVHILNTDLKLVNKNYLQDMIIEMEKNPKIGLIGPCIQRVNGEIQNTTMSFPSLKKIIFNYNNPQKSKLSSPPELINTEVLNGVCLLINADLFNRLNGFDKNIFMYGEEHEFCYRVKKLNYQCKYWSNTSFVHFEGNKPKKKRI